MTALRTEMTHGDQAKAKAAKGSQASGFQKSSSKTAGKAVQGGKSGKDAGKSGVKDGGEGGKAAKILVRPQQAGAEKGRLPAASGKEAGNGGKGGKARPAAAAAAGSETGFTNPAVASAFERALKKYPNAFRKLTD